MKRTAEKIMRKGKTRQDLQPADQRERVQNANRVRDFSQKHKPSKSSDWTKLRLSTHH